MPCRQSLRRAVLAAMLFGAPALAHAQAVLGIGDDATTLPGGGLRIGVFNGWSRFSERFDDAGHAIPLAPALTSDAAGVAQFEALAPLQRDVRQLSGSSSFNVSIGHTTLNERALVRTTPVSAELGITHWLQVGVMMPIVRTQTAVDFRVNSGGAGGNVGVNPALTTESAASANATLLQQFATAATALSAQIDACKANSSGANCATVLANGPALLATSRRFAAGIAQVYGASLFVPLGGTSADSAIRARVGDFGARYDSLGIGGITSAGPVASQTPAGVADVQRFVTDSAFGIAGDSLQTTDHIGLGDIELSAKIQWLNTLGQAERFRARPGFAVRSAITGVVRLGTGAPPLPGDFLGIGTGDGQTDVEVRSENDVVLGHRFWASLVGRYGIQLADQRLMRIADPEHPIVGAYREFSVQRDLGDYYALSFTPRVVLGSYFSLGAQYMYRHKNQDRYTGTLTTTNFVGDTVTLDASILDRETAIREQRVTAGLVYSTLAAYAAGKTRWPIEVSFQHSTSVAGSGGRTPKLTEDRVQVRIYAHLFGGPMWGRP